MWHRCITSIIVHIFVVWYVVAERVCTVCSVIVHIDLSSSFLKNKVIANTTKHQSCFMYVLCQSVKNKIKCCFDRLFCSKEVFFLCKTSDGKAKLLR